MALTWDITPAPDDSQYSLYKDGVIPVTPPIAPHNVRMASGYPTENEARYLFDYSSGQNQTGFDAEWWATSDPSTKFSSVLSVGATSVDLTGLTPSTGYSFRIRAFSGSTKGIWASEQSFQTSSPSSGDTDLDMLTVYSHFDGLTAGTEAGDWSSPLEIGNGELSCMTNAKATVIAEDGYSGRKCLKQFISDTDGTAIGFSLSPLSTLKLNEGDEMWARVIWRLSPGWDWRNSDGSAKCLRSAGLTTDNPDAQGHNRGRIEIKMSRSADGSTPIPSNCQYYRGIDIHGDNVDTGRYENLGGSPGDLDSGFLAMELYIYLSVDPEKSIVRYFQNGVYQSEGRQQTLTDSETWGPSYLKLGLSICTYWNGGYRGSQSDYMLLDSFTLACKQAGGRDDTPYLSTDSNGRKLIGMKI